MACWEYDRTRPLLEKRIQPEGLDLTFTCLRPEDTFRRQAQHQEFDISEFSLSYHTFLTARGDWPYVAIPVFLSRFFRHSCIFINTHAGISRPEDLIGKTVGVPWYPMSAAVWMRAFLQHDYGVLPSHIHWRDVHDVFPWNRPHGLEIERIGPNQSLADMLESGEIAALLTARQPVPFRNGSPNIARLFPNYRAVEEDYFRRTRLFPIMHTVIVRKEILKEHPWVAQSLYDALTKAKLDAYEDLHEADALKVTLPWVTDEAERTQQLMGKDFWPYGLAANRHVIEALVRYSHEQGLAVREVPVEELYVPID
jgi:4,5-dihydroxyphthalate decarboxylase